MGNEEIRIQIMNKIQLEDKIKGALVGLACGDAVGTTLEFIPRGVCEPITDMVGGGPFKLDAGQWTDDTSMALCLAHSLAYCKGFDAADQMNHILKQKIHSVALWMNFRQEMVQSCDWHPYLFFIIMIMKVV